MIKLTNLKQIGIGKFFINLRIPGGAQERLEYSFPYFIRDGINYWPNENLVS